MLGQKGLKLCEDIGHTWSQKDGITMTLSNLLLHDNKIIVGYTTTKHFMLDLDNTSLDKVLGLAKLLRENYRDIGNMLIMQSSISEKDIGTKIGRDGIPRHGFKGNNYHLIGNNIMHRARITHIINTLVDLNILSHRYRTIRSFRGDITLRVSPMVLSNGIKQEPIPVAYLDVKTSSKQDGMIDEYRRFRVMVVKFFMHLDQLRHDQFNANQGECADDGENQYLP